VSSQKDTSHVLHGMIYRMVRHHGGPSSGVMFRLTETELLSGRANEVADSLVVLADRPSNQ
jgi:hypothetical protein